MKVGTILLDPFDRYIDKNGKLPERPYVDKSLLKSICSKGTVSLEGFDLLPNSITSITQVDALLTNKASITYVDSTKSTILGQTMPNTYGVTRVFSQMTTPTPNAVGDLWIDLSAN